MNIAVSLFQWPRMTKCLEDGVLTKVEICDRKK